MLVGQRGNDLRARGKVDCRLCRLRGGLRQSLVPGSWCLVRSWCLVLVVLVLGSLGTKDQEPRTKDLPQGREYTPPHAERRASSLLLVAARALRRRRRRARASIGRWSARGRSSSTEEAVDTPEPSRVTNPRGLLVLDARRLGVRGHHPRQPPAADPGAGVAHRGPAGVCDLGRLLGPLQRGRGQQAAHPAARGLVQPQRDGPRVRAQLRRDGRSAGGDVAAGRAARARRHALDLGESAAGREPVTRLPAGGGVLAARDRVAREPDAEDRGVDEAGAERRRLHAVGLRGRPLPGAQPQAVHLGPARPTPRPRRRCAATSATSAPWGSTRDRCSTRFSGAPCRRARR